jgi:hypothetical protein
MNTIPPLSDMLGPTRTKLRVLALARRHVRAVQAH